MLVVSVTVCQDYLLKLYQNVLKRCETLRRKHFLIPGSIMMETRNLQHIIIYLSRICDVLQLLRSNLITILSLMRFSFIESIYTIHLFQVEENLGCESDVALRARCQATLPPPVDVSKDTWRHYPERRRKQFAALRTPDCCSLCVSTCLYVLN